MITTPTTNMNAVHADFEESAFPSYLRPLPLETYTLSSFVHASNVEAWGLPAQGIVSDFTFPALGLVFPDQPFWRGKSRFWSPRDHNSKG